MTQMGECRCIQIQKLKWWMFQATGKDLKPYLGWPSAWFFRGLSSVFEIHPLSSERVILSSISFFVPYLLRKKSGHPSHRLSSRGRSEYFLHEHFLTDGHHSGMTPKEIHELHFFLLHKVQMKENLFKAATKDTQLSTRCYQCFYVSLTWDWKEDKSLNQWIEIKKCFFQL